MRKTNQCPKCKGRDLGYARRERGSERSVWVGDQTVTAETWVCIGCGHCEIYVLDVHTLLDEEDFVRVNAGTADVGPYR